MFTIKQRKIAIMVEDVYEDLEFWYPYYRLKEAGCDITVVGPDANTEYESKHGYKVKTDMCRFDASNTDWDAVIIPGGYAPDKMRRYSELVDIVKTADKNNKIVAAICHGPWMMTSADIIKGREVTSFFSIKDDLINAGGNWVDKEVAVDNNLITSRSPADLPTFMKEILNKL